MEMKTSQLIFLAVILLGIAGVLLFISNLAANHTAKAIATYEECVAAGNPILESYPTQCRTKDGRMFVNPEQTGQRVKPPSGPPPGPIAAHECVPAGCSRELCVEADTADNIASTCVYKQEYACYKTAYCKRQADGKCGWTQSDTLKACVANAQESAPQEVVY